MQQSTFISDKISSCTHDALLIFQQFPNVSGLRFQVENVELENMPPESPDELFCKSYTHIAKVLPGKSALVKFISVSTI